MQERKKSSGAVKGLQHLSFFSSENDLTCVMCFPWRKQTPKGRLALINLLRSPSHMFHLYFLFEVSDSLTRRPTTLIEHNLCWFPLALFLVFLASFRISLSLLSSMCYSATQYPSWFMQNLVSLS